MQPFVKDNLPEIERILKAHKVKRAYFFGSVVTDRFRKALDEIESFTGEQKDFKQFQRSPMMRAAIERKIEIIGEAMNEALAYNA